MANTGKSESRRVEWSSPDQKLIAHVGELTESCLASYRVNPRLVEEHANLELDITLGGYGKRQLFELIQNGADAMVGTRSGRVHVILTDRHLYCANEGAPIDARGIDALLHAFLSVKRGDEIGRFGLGFKSVLGMTKSPEFFCRAVSFAFSQERAKARISAVVPSAQRYPVLRLAELLKPIECSKTDAILHGLMSWATTVVRLERNAGPSSWLEEDVAAFPREFLLFCPQVSELILENRRKALIRRIKLKKRSEQTMLVESGEETEWRVFHTVHKPSDEARLDAGELAGRDRLPVHWALAMADRPGPGHFWAFFPLSDRTTLSGVINAPWKTNDDRTNLLPGKFNEELLGVAAQLAVANLAAVSKENDPAWHLDVLPARGREVRSWADDVLTRVTYQLAAKAPSLPNQRGELQRPEDIRLHPDVVPREVLDTWSAQPGRPEDWCHPSVETRDRRPRVERLLELAGRSPATLCDWISALKDQTRPESFRGPIRVASQLVRAKPDVRSALANCWILIDQDGKAARPFSNEVFLPPSDGRVMIASVPLIHPSLAADKSLRDALNDLEVVPVTADLELRVILKKGIQGWGDSDWDRFWQLVRLVGNTAPEIIKEMRNYRTRLKVRTVSGGYKHLHYTLLPGPVVPADGSRDGAVAIDMRHHQGEVEILTALGAVAVPTPEFGVPEGEYFQAYSSDCARVYCEQLESSSPQPQWEKLVFSRRQFAGPLEPLSVLSEAARRTFTDALLQVENELLDWTMFHETRSQYPKRQFGSPVLAAIHKLGLLGTTLGPRPTHQCVAPSLSSLGAFLPVAQCSEQASLRLKLPRDVDSLSQPHWAVALDRAETVDDDDLLGNLYALAARAVQSAPSLIRCRVGSDHRLEAPKSVTVVTSRREFEALVRDKRPVIFAPSEAEATHLVEQWGLTPAGKSVRTELLFAPSGPAAPILDRFPALQLRLRDENVGKIDNIELLPCSELSIATLTDAGKAVESVNIHQKGTTVCWLDTLSESSLLDRLNSFFDLDLTAEDQDVVLSERVARRIRERTIEIRKLQTPAEKLLAAIGPDAVRRHIPLGLVQAVENDQGELSPGQLAELAMVVYGVDVLRECKRDLQLQGFQPPDQWAGRGRALSFVRELGFGPEYAGAEEEKRPEVVRVDGPSTLPALHQFQLNITKKLKSLLRSAMPDRGLVSLPTGAGKTRVAVQALVEEIGEGRLAGPVLWVAQSDELCEQAVQAWAEIWHALGPRRRMYLCRLWGSNELESMPDAAQVVVATIQKLQGCVDAPEYEWLSHAACIVIDEAHHATEPSYTRVLEWQGVRPRNARCPLIGLTATPFRGHSEEETKRLVARFGGTLLDVDLGPDPYAHLQDIEVLARVQHQLLGGVEIRLDPEEVEHIKKFKTLPPSVNAQIAANVDRNKQLVEDIAMKPSSWPIIVFAASVEHAQTLAALLSLKGVKAAPISATTDPGTRRHYLERFRRNEIQILTNYNVLTQGFDAPSVRAVYVARPTFSPTVYQQMIGRGLRGKKNGGKEECLIVNIADTFARFGTDLAFREFEYLWKPRP